MFQSLMRRFTWQINPYAQSDAFCPPGFSRIGDCKTDDVFIAGYPKSGHTWLQEIVACLQYGLAIGRSPDSLVQELVPDVRFKKYYKRFKSPVVFKTHDLPHPRHRRVINIVRDGRDVMCSYKAFLENLGQTYSLDKMISTGAGLFPCFWHDHVNAWLDNPYDAAILLVRYEDMKFDTVHQLHRISQFLELNVSIDEYESIASETTVGKMQLRERKFGWDNTKWPKDKPFVRNGVVGGFRNELSNEQIERIEMTGARAFARLGYEISICHSAVQD